MAIITAVLQLTIDKKPLHIKHLLHILSRRGKTSAIRAETLILVFQYSVGDFICVALPQLSELFLLQPQRAV